jgi:hypothetical protein
MWIVIILLAFLTLVNVILTFSVIGAIGISQTVLLAEVQHQARITRRALVELLNPEEPTEQQKTLSAIVNGPEFQRVVEESAGAQGTNATDWFGERNDAQA